VIAMTLADKIAQSILSSRSEAIIAADRAGRILFWNVGAEVLFGHPATTAVGSSLDIIIPERLRKAHWKGYMRAMDSGASRYGDGEVLAVPGVRRDGSRISLEFSIAFLRDADGSAAGLVAVLRDVTPRYEELRALRRRLKPSDAHTAQ
jgi:PAS domain S-box-containing protein